MQFLVSGRILLVSKYYPINMLAVRNCPNSHDWTNSREYASRIDQHYANYIYRPLYHGSSSSVLVAVNFSSGVQSVKGYQWCSPSELSFLVLNPLPSAPALRSSRTLLVLGPLGCHFHGCEYSYFSLSTWQAFQGKVKPWPFIAHLRSGNVSCD